MIDREILCDILMNVEATVQSRQSTTIHSTKSLSQRNYESAINRFDERHQILKPISQNDNLCLFYSAINGLQNIEERIAFANGNLSRPCLEFVKLCRFRNFSTPNENDVVVTVDKVDIGYNQIDIEDYLKHLKNNNIIGEFVWMRERRFKTHKMFSQKYSKIGVYVFLGQCVGEYIWKERIRKLKKIKNQFKDKNESFDDAYYFDNKIPIFDFKNEDTTMHAVSVSYDINSEEFHIYDSGKVIRLLLSVENLIKRLARIDRVHILKL
jgi:hypothetical protein